MASPNNKNHFDDDEDMSSTPPPAPLRQRVGDEVEAEVPPPTVEKFVLVPQDDSGSDGEGSGNDDFGNDDFKGSDSDDGEDKAIHNPFRMTPWFKCLICLREEYDCEAKVVLHVVEVIKQDARSPDQTWSNDITRCFRPDDDDDYLTSVFIVI
jgi:hypothetical protein